MQGKIGCKTRMYYRDKKWLENIYLKEKKSSPEIADICGVDVSTICNWLKFHEVKVRTHSQTMKGWKWSKEIIEKRANALKGRKFSIEHKRKFSERQNGNKNSNWKGGRIIDGYGYVYVREIGHPNAKKRGGYVLESHLIAEKALGRYLKDDEMTHHINEKRHDNHKENLLVCTKSYHTWLHWQIRRL